jgi:hypothetical protein
MRIDIPDHLANGLLRVLERESKRLRARRTPTKGATAGEVFDEIEACRVVSACVWTIEPELVKVGE